MEGLIPFLMRSVNKKQRRNHDYRRLSEIPSRAGYQLSTTRGGESVVNSSHRRTRSEFHPARFDIMEHATTVDSSRKSFCADSMPMSSSYSSSNAVASSSASQISSNFNAIENY